MHEFTEVSCFWSNCAMNSAKSGQLAPMIQQCLAQNFQEKHLHSRFQSSINNGIVSDACSPGLLSKVRSIARHMHASKLSSQHPSKYLADILKHKSQLEAAAGMIKSRILSQTVRSTSLSILHDALPLMHASVALWSAARATQSKI